MIYPDSTYISFRDWADSLFLEFPEVPFATYVEGADWREWATQAIRFPFFSRFNIVAPDFFPTWDSWAQEFYRITEAGTDE